MSTSEGKTAVDLHTQRQEQRQIAKEGGVHGRRQELYLLWGVCVCVCVVVQDGDTVGIRFPSRP